jgi:cellulose synthase/poly-beta-1,6-N-acetylglucosamine synthase-like glycosyltransferase
MLSCIITAYKEARTIGKAITCMEKACNKVGWPIDYEILVFAPDDETINEALNYETSRIKIFKDEGKGKPSALNIAFQEAKGHLLILSDGDVYVNQYAIRELINKTAERPEIGAVSGRPKSISPRNTMLGYWSHLLTDMAHLERTKAGGNFVCSGYLYALRRGIVEEMPAEVLSDDAYTSYKVIESGKKIDYAQGAQVFVKYPDNFKDWMAQKKRSTGGYVQLDKVYKLKPIKEMRSIGQEIRGVWKVLSYPRSLKEFFWTLALIGARIWLWINIFWEQKVIKKDFNKTWTRISSTK